jgi:hypothetical protein
MVCNATPPSTIFQLYRGGLFSVTEVFRVQWKVWGIVVPVIVWWLDLQLHMQSVPSTTNVVGPTPADFEDYNIMW